MSRFVAFSVGGARYALPVDQVQQIVKHEGITEVPQSPEYVEGVKNLRGEVIPIMSMRGRFGLPAEESGRRSRIIIASVGGKSYGLHVDDVRDIVDVPDEQVETDNIDMINVRSDLVIGIAKTPAELLIVLDMERILTTTDAVLLDD